MFELHSTKHLTHVEFFPSIHPFGGIMESKKVSDKIVAAAFLLVSLLPIRGQAQRISEAGPSDFAYSSNRAYEVPGNYTYEYDNSRYLYEKRPYDTGVYYYNRSGIQFDCMNRYNGYYNTSYTAGAYTSGVSSYPGTSTGPGISNGYSGTPKGTYSTDSRYYDRNIRPNPDAYYYRR